MSFCRLSRSAPNCRLKGGDLSTMITRNAGCAVATSLLIGWATGEAAAQPRTWAPITPPPPAGEIRVLPPIPLALPDSVTPVPATPVCAPPAASRHNIEGNCIGYLSEFQQPPLGYSVAEHFRTQVRNGAAARMTLYDLDFVTGSNKLNYRGKDRLRHVVDMLMALPFPLVIERTPRFPELADARRQAVMDELNEWKISVPPNRIIVGIPIAFPLYGLEAEAIYQNLLNQTESRGASSRSGGGTTGGGASSSFGPSSGFGSSGSGGSGSSGGNR